MLTLLRTNKRIANKHHICNYCSTTIEKGDEYLDSVCVQDNIYHWCSHLHCDKLTYLLDMWKESYCDGLDEESFQQYIIEEYKNITNITENSDFYYCLNYLIKHFNL